jgi:hypothetical protein
MFHLLLESVLPEFDHYLVIYPFFNFAILMTMGNHCADHMTPSIRKSWHYFANKRNKAMEFSLVLVVLPPIQNVVGICKQITILILY